MTKLYVVPHDVMAILQAEDIPVSVFKDVRELIKRLSASDIADIHQAMLAFPFHFDPEVNLTLALSPAAVLLSEEQHTSLHYRVKERVDSYALQPTTEESYYPSYTLNPVDENVWVAVVQRHHTDGSDPGRQLLVNNRSFFDGLIAQVLHTLSFEKMCATNLFTYYLGSLTPTNVES